MEEQIYIDGVFLPKSNAKVSVFDHGFLYGDGVFEGIRAYNGVIFRLKEHINRMYASAHTIMLEMPLTKEKMAEAVIETMKKNGLKDAYIRLIVTRGAGDLGLDPRKCPKPCIVIIVGKIVLMPKEKIESGIKVIITWLRRDQIDGTSHEVKSLNYLNSVLAKIEANNVSADEAIFLSHEGYVCEGTAENIFMVKDGMLFTPPTYTGALPGITQAAVISIAESIGIQVCVRPITPHELFNADELLFTGTAAEIIPVSQVNGRAIGAVVPGNITKKLMLEFINFVSNPLNGVKCI